MGNPHPMGNTGAGFLFLQPKADRGDPTPLARNKNKRGTPTLFLQEFAHKGGKPKIF